ncbi:MAG: DUF362 domain-containing protein [Acidobacteriaceae bacterium]|jgi:uncharacterized protein (DUF362 family)|nr:DUF362 domain-containing protein [Acidobacteriaceae bacterium]
MVRRALTAALAAGLASCQKTERKIFSGSSPVAVLRAKSYQIDLTNTILEGIRLCGLDVKGKTVLLKPNLVEFDASTAINTDVALVAAALEAFRSLGAASVTIAEGPGHRRDTLGVADEAGYWKGVRNFEGQFVDLNRDDVTPVSNFVNEKQFFLPNTALGADLIVSMPKMKTHHWAAATLSMKNLFGLVPGSVYGWPKNTLHYIGIDNSIVALNRQFRKTFAIVDGIVGMEGNGPIQGQAKNVGLLVFGQDLVAVDSTCCRIMGIDPAKVAYLQQAADLGAIAPGQIQQRGENPHAVRNDFQLISEFAAYRLSPEGAKA